MNVHFIMNGATVFRRDLGTDAMHRVANVILAHRDYFDARDVTIIATRDDDNVIRLIRRRPVTD